MDRRAVQALRVVLENQLPVGSHIVRRPITGNEVRQAEPREAADEWRPRNFQGRGLLVDVDEQESFPLGYRGGVQRIIELAEAGDLLHVGRGKQAAIDGVRPSIIGALDRLAEMAGRFTAEAGAAMSADVEMGSERSA